MIMREAVLSCLLASHLVVPILLLAIEQICRGIFVKATQYETRIEHAALQWKSLFCEYLKSGLSRCPLRAQRRPDRPVLGGSTRGLSPRGKCLGSEEAVGGGAGEVTGNGEDVVGSSVHREEALRRVRRLEPLHLSLASADRDMGAFGAVVKVLARHMRASCGRGLRRLRG